MPDDAEDSERGPHKRAILIFAALFLSIGCAAFVIYAYMFRLAWTGFNPSTGPNVLQYQPAKTLWDWFQLLIIPIVLVVVTYRFNRINSQTEQRITAQREKTEHAIALDNQRATLLQDYLDRMSDLLLEQKLRDPRTSQDTKNIARARTLITLPSLDGVRKGRLLQ